MRCRLFFIPFAGGNRYSYDSLKPFISEQVEPFALELPGRGQRTRESRLKSIDEASADIFEQIRSNMTSKYMIFGHSLGATLAFLACGLVEASGLQPPECLIVSGALPPSKGKVNMIHLLPTEQFWTKLKDLGGINDAVLENVELREYAEPILRDDFEMVANFTPLKDKRINTPMKVLFGESEPITMEEAEEWRTTTYRHTELYSIPGGHFFIHESPARVAEIINASVVES